MQIDWLTASIKTPPEILLGYRSGQGFLVDSHGGVIKEYSTYTQVAEDENEPSSSRNFSFITPDPYTLRISGNPVKLIQGHNLWGSTDLFGLYLTAGAFIRTHCGNFPGPQTYLSSSFTRPAFSRIDLTRSYRFDSEQQAMEFMRDVVSVAHSRQGAASMYGAETGYFGQSSRRYTMKIYRKHPEFLKETKKIKRAFSAETRQLADWTQGVVRFELTIRNQEIKDLSQNYDFTNKKHLLEIWQSKFDKIQFNENAAMTKQTHIAEANLTPQQLGVLARWRQGDDLRSDLSKTAFYRYRKVFLEELAVDIKSVPQDFSDQFKPAPKLEDKGWDPEPLTASLVEPDEQLKLAYGFSK